MKTNIISSIALCGLLCFTALSCKDSNEEANAYVNSISRNVTQADSLRSLRMSIQAFDNQEFGEAMRAQVADSSASVRGFVYALTLDDGALAEYVCRNPDRDFYMAVLDCRTLTDGNEARDRFVGEVAGCLPRLEIPQQARFVTTVSRPEDVALCLEPGDTSLLSAIRRIYSAEPELHRRFEQALSGNGE